MTATDPKRSFMPIRTFFVFSAGNSRLRLFITINSMPVPERIKQECKRAERNTMVPYALITFGFWQAAEYYKLNATLGVLGTLFVLYLASMHLAGERHRPTVAIASIVALAISALSGYLFSDMVFLLVAVVGFGFVIFLSSNLRRRQIVRDFSPRYRNWPD